jgi:prolyl oligopeptidase
MRNVRSLSILVLLSFLAISCATKPAPPPAPAVAAADPLATVPSARVATMTETLHGVQVDDPYRWMETTSDEFTRFVDAQDVRARAVLGKLPRRDAIRDAIAAADRGVTRVNIGRVTGDRRRPRVFLWRRHPDADSYTIWVRDGWTGDDRLLIDPAKRATATKHYSVDYISPSDDGHYLAYGISESGSEDSVIEILDVDSGTVLPERIDRSQYAGISWRPDNRSFFYWRRAKPREGAARSEWFMNSATHLHVIGADPESEAPLFGPMVPGVDIAPESFSGIGASPASNWILAVATPGTSADLEYFIAPASEASPGGTIHWRRLSTNHDHIRGMSVYGDRVYAMSYDSAPRFKIVSFDARDGSLATATTFVPPSRSVIDSFAPARDGLYVQFLDGGISRLERVSWDGKERLQIALPYAGAIDSLVAEPDRDGATFAMSGWTKARRLYMTAPAVGVRDLQLVEAWPHDYSAIVVEEVEVPSADGTMVPMSILHRRGDPLDGTLPALIDGYAAYGSPQTPYFNPISLTWVEQGAVFAECHARGGGAFGEEWHLAGSKLNKERGIEDVIACAEYLVKNHYTTTKRLSITGTSAGGVLAGGTITRRPDLFTAALLRVPMVNLSRFETTEGGPANVPEFGSTKDPAEFRALFASDPYYRLKPGTTYPAMVVTGGLHDVRVPVWIPAKFVAKAQAMGGPNPILFRVEREAGHGLGSKRSNVREEWSDLFAFALWRSE